MSVRNFQQSDIFHLLAPNLCIPSGEVCLPKPKSKLNFKMVDGVPGLGIVDSDEDWTDLNIFEDLVLKSRFASTAQSVGIFLIKSICDNDEPTFFASDEEAQELVKKHFPGKCW